jgi:predicted ArsR family transcriptional regulator
LKTRLTLRQKILGLLKNSPMTANAIAKTLRYDKGSVRKLLLVLERQGIVKCTPLKRGGVTYKFWQLEKERGKHGVQGS